MPKTSTAATSSPDPLHALLAAYTPHDAAEEACATQLRQFLSMTNNAYCRSNLVAHVVADAWIVNPARTHVVLVEHALNKQWMAPGGHCDGDPDVLAAAHREAAEEAGLTNLRPLLDGAIFDLNTGTVPARTRYDVIEPAHVHFDVCFAFETDDRAPLSVSDESTGLAWVALAELDRATYRASHLRRIEKTLKGMI